jgi:hypothetical protein
MSVPEHAQVELPVWDLLLVPERFRTLHLLLGSVVYDGSTGELELSFYPLGIPAWRPRLPGPVRI